MTYKHGKIAAIGDKDSIAVFKTVGIDTFITSLSDANAELKRLTKEHYSVIFVTEELAAAISDTLDKLKARTYPIVTVIPTASGAAKGYARQSLDTDIQKALGIKRENIV